MLEEPDDNRLDQSLRDLFSDYDLPPARHVWTGIERQLANMPPHTLPVRKRRPVPLPLLFTMTALLAGLGGWLLPHGSAPAARRVELASQPAASTRQQVRTTVVRPAAIASVKRQRTIESPKAGSVTTAAPLALVQAVNQSTAPSASSSVRNGSIHELASTARSAAPVTSPSTAAVVAAVAAGTVEQPAAPTVALALPGREEAATREEGSAVPASLLPLVALTRKAEATPSVVLSAEAVRTQQITTLRAQRDELLRLRIHTDSLLIVLGDVPVAVPSAMAAAAPTATAAPTDTAKPKALTRRWSLQLAAAPEQNALSLEGPEDDKLTTLRRGHETGRAGVNAHLMAEYRLNQRFSLGAGLGYSAFGAELRVTNRHTEVDVDYQTSSTTTATAVTSTHQSYSIRITQVPMLNPIFNSSFQVIGYDTVYTTRQDTLFTTTVLHDSIRTTNTTTTPILTRREVTTSTTLQPNYRFATLPILVRYRLSPVSNSRFWTDVALGAQLQLFLGGTQAVTEDGVNFRTETISAGASPFRTLNVALSGSLALNYALSDRLSVSAAPSLRWQALSLYKSDTGLKQQPTATGLLLGVRWRL